MRAEIISVGTELLLGQIVDTNASYLAQRLAELGIDVYFKQTVGDNPRRIGQAVGLAMSRADLILMTGGLGPTEDDLTIATVATALGDELVHDGTVADAIRQFFEVRGRVPPDSVYKQAWRPSRARVMLNSRGTAPGVHLEHQGRTIFILPGVPYEMEGMMEHYVLPLLRGRPGAGPVIGSRVLRVTGEGESAVEERIRDLIHGTAPTIAPYAKLGEVHLRLTAKGLQDDVVRDLERGEALVRARLGDLVYGVDGQTLEEVVASMLIARALTVAVAESCTGGLVGERLTNVPGSSAYFSEGVVAYSNAAKVALGVDLSLITTHGAVSAEVGEAMAAAIRRRAGSAIGLSVTGIAGPSGGTLHKPVGLVFLALADADGVLHRRLTFGSEPGRRGIRSLAAQAALNLLRRHLLQR